MDVSEAIRFLKDKSPDFQALLRSLSKARFENISGRKIFETLDHPHPDDYVYGSHQTLIQIAAKDLRVTFKSHFALTHTENLIRKTKNPKKSRQKAIYDLFMEYSNLVAGGLSQRLHSGGIVSGISLPMATTGFDELLASDSVKGTSYFDYWLVKGDGFSFTCTAQVDLLSDAWLKDFVFSEDKAESEGGELEFL